MELDDLVAPLRLVSVLDPAIDRAATDVQKYAETRDLSLVKTLPGSTARIYTVRALDVYDFSSADVGTATARLIRCFVLALEQIENWPVPGHVWTPSRRMDNGQGGDRVVMSDSELKALYHRLGARVIYEIAGVIYTRALEGNGQGGGVRYTLPPSSVEGLEEIARRLAEQARTSAGTTNSDASSSANQTPSVKASAAGTAADAAASGGTASLAG